MEMRRNVGRMIVRMLNRDGIIEMIIDIVIGIMIIEIEIIIMIYKGVMNKGDVLIFGILYVVMVDVINMQINVWQSVMVHVNVEMGNVWGIMVIMVIEVIEIIIKMIIKRMIIITMITKTRIMIG